MALTTAHAANTTVKGTRDIRKAIGFHAPAPAGFYDEVLGHKPRIHSYHIGQESWPKFVGDFKEKVLTNIRKDAEEGTLCVVLVRPLMKRPLKGRKDSMSLADGADGLYDKHWREIGSILNKLPQETLDNIVLRIGHEMTGAWFAWGTTRKGEKKGDPQLSREFAGYWRRIHSSINSRLKYKRVRYDFNFSGNHGIGDALMCYPGSQYVDIISTDMYANGSGWRIDGKSDAKKMKSLLLDPMLVWASKERKLVAIDETAIVNYAPQKGVRGNQDGADGGPGGDDYVGWFETIARWMEEAAKQGMLSHVIIFDVNNSKGIRSVLYRSEEPEYILPGREDWKYIGRDGKFHPTNNPNCAAYLVDKFGIPAKK